MKVLQSMGGWAEIGRTAVLAGSFRKSVPLENIPTENLNQL